MRCDHQVFSRSPLIFALFSVGDLRLRRPVLIDHYRGKHIATQYGPSCPQQQLPAPSGLPSDLDLGYFAKMMSNVYDTSAPEAEDCKPSPLFCQASLQSHYLLVTGLSLNIWSPSNVGVNSSLPVAFVSASMTSFSCPILRTFLLQWIHGG